MATIAISVIRDEADIVRQTVTQMAHQVDHVIVADNGSTDGTREILEDIGVQIVDDGVRGFYQAIKMTELAQMAGGMGADWVVPFDADELWSALPGQTIKSTCESMPDGVDAVGAVFWDHLATDADDPAELDPIVRMGYRRLGNGEMLRIAARVRPDLVIEDGNHFACNNDGVAFAWPCLAVRHYSLRSFDQFAAKARKCVEGVRTAGLHPAIATHWREWAAAVDAGDEAVLAIWESKLIRNPADDYTLIFDPVEA